MATGGMTLEEAKKATEEAQAFKDNTSSKIYHPPNSAGGGKSSGGKGGFGKK